MSKATKEIERQMTVVPSDFDKPLYKTQSDRIASLARDIGYCLERMSECRWLSNIRIQCIRPDEEDGVFSIILRADVLYANDRRDSEIGLRFVESTESDIAGMYVLQCKRPDGAWVDVPLVKEIQDNAET